MVQSKGLSKVCLRHLPPDITSAELLEIISPLPPHDYYKFHKGDISLYPMNMCRAYINFPSFSDVMEFQGISLRVLLFYHSVSFKLSLTAKFSSTKAE